MDKLKVYLDNCCFYITNIKQECFDYTEWQSDNLFEDMTLDELVNDAAEFERQHPEFIPKNATLIF